VKQILYSRIPTPKESNSREESKVGLAEKVSGMPASKRANEDVCLYFE
jgi:hypothetical protein